MNMKIIVIAPISILVLIALVPNAFAHTDKYYIGYSQGQTQARTDYAAYAQDYRPFCPVYDSWTAANGPHSSNFCAGFIDGYNQAWYALVWKTHNERVSQSTDQSVSIRGDHNKVVQQTINNVGNTGSGSGRGHGGYQPSCTVLCSIIKIN